MKQTFKDDRSVQALRDLNFVVSSLHRSQQEGADRAATMAKILARLMESTREFPRRSDATTKSSFFVYSGRFSPDALKLAKLLGRGFSPDARDENGWTDLHYAAVLNLPGLASALLDAGADPNAKAKRDDKALSNRCKSILSQFGIDAGNQVRVGAVPLRDAAWFNAHSAASVLLAYGAKVDVQTTWGDTPLHAAAYFNAPSFAELLIGQGASPRVKINANLPNFEGYTPLDMSVANKAAEAEALLRRHEAPCNKKCS